ncbi:MAG: methyltransferase domain-containing protein [Methylococcales bacterium]|nr:methyltransferase domain-containing protein [Methylococcales bacterium]
MTTNNDQDILACPSCKNPLPEIEQCDSCGLEFKSDEGTPVLLGENLNRVVQFTFTSDRSYMPDDAIEKILKDPELAESNDLLPYHMDVAHVHIINQLKKGSRILEIGCGGGQNRKFFEGMGFTYIGIDISKTRVFDWLQDFEGPDYLCDTHFLPFQDQKFDLVYCAAVFEHLASPYLAAQEAHRVLKPGGYFLGNVAFLEPWHDNSYFHISPLGVIEMLTQADFKIENVWPGRGYSGYFAMAVMGNQFTNALRWVGKIMHFTFRLGYKIKSMIRKHDNPKFADILNRAKVAGAIDWIAQRPIK